MNEIRVSGNLELKRREAFGTAARRNRGSYTGTKIHRLYIEEVIRVLNVEEELAKAWPTFGKTFLKTGKPVIYSSRPACGVTGGQNAARENPKLTASDVTCANCKS